MRHALAAGLVALAVWTAHDLRASEDAGLRTRVLDVSMLVEPVRDAPLGAFGVICSPGARVNSPMPGSGLVEPQDLIDLLLEAAGGDPPPGAFLRMQAGGRILVRHRPEMIRRIESRLRDLERAVVGPVRVRVRWLTFGEESSRRLEADGTLTALAESAPNGTTVARLVEETRRPGNRMRSGTVEVPRGRRAAIVRIERTTALVGYEAEVAQWSRIGDPTVVPIREGLDVLVRPRPLSAGGRIALEVLARTGRLRRPVRSLLTNATELGLVDLPEIGVTELGLSGAPAANTPLVALMDRPEGPGGPALGVLLVKATLDRRETGLVEAGFLVSAPESWRLPHPEEIDLDERPRCTLPGPVFIEEPQRVDASLLEAYPSTDSVLDTAGLLVATDLRAARAVVRALEEPLARTYRIEATLLSLPPGEDARARGRVVRRADLTALAGQWAAARSGLTRVFLTDYETEIAKDEAQIAVPRPVAVLLGWTLHARPLPLTGRRMELRIRLRHGRVDPRSAERVVRTGATHIGVMQHPRVDEVRFEGDLSIEVGETTWIDSLGGDPESPGRSLALRIVVRRS